MDDSKGIQTRNETHQDVGEHGERRFVPQVGEYYIPKFGTNSEYQIYRVVAVIDDNPDKIKIALEYQWPGRTEWSRYGEPGLEQFTIGHPRCKYFRLPHLDFDRLEEELREDINRDRLLYLPDDADEAREEAADVAKGLTVADPNPIRRINENLNRFNAVAHRGMMLATVMRRKAHALIAAQMELIEPLLAEMNVRVNYLERVKALLDNFMGVYEEIVLVRDGQPAGEDAPIHIMQAIDIMDELVGDVAFRELGYETAIRGLDFNSIEVFDEWLADGDHIDLVCPYPKCIAALHVSRQRHQRGKYSSNLIVSSMIDKENERIYLVIRNGEKISRIFTKLDFNDRLLPEDEEWADLLQEVDKAETTVDALKAKMSTFTWHNRVLLFQGLVMRTDVFDPVRKDLNFFGTKEFVEGEVVRVMNAGGVVLNDGRPSYRQWRKEMMASLEQGDEVFLARYNYDDYRRHGDHIDRWRVGDQYYNWLPEGPESGYYKIVEKKEILREKITPINDDEWDAALEAGTLRQTYRYSKVHKGIYWEGETRVENVHYKILYWPGGSQDSEENQIGWEPGIGYKQRQKRIGFWLSRDDWFVFPAHMVGLEDIEYYIDRRVDRSDYLRVLPTLYAMRDILKAQMAQEDEFIRFFCQRYEVQESRVRLAMQWWKEKNKWKRPLSEDNEKAWRMIARRLKIELPKVQK